MGIGRGNTHLLSLQYWMRCRAKLHTGCNDQVSGDTACNYHHGDQTTGFAEREHLQTHLIAVFVLLSFWNNLSSVVAMVNSLATLVSGWGPLKRTVFCVSYGCLQFPTVWLVSPHDMVQKACVIITGNECFHRHRDRNILDTVCMCDGSVSHICWVCWTLWVLKPQTSQWQNP